METKSDDPKEDKSQQQLHENSHPSEEGDVRPDEQVQEQQENPGHQQDQVKDNSGLPDNSDVNSTSGTISATANKIIEYSPEDQAKLLADAKAAEQKKIKEAEDSTKMFLLNIEDCTNKNTVVSEEIMESMVNDMGKDSKDKVKDWITRTLHNVREAVCDDFLYSKLMDQQLKVII